MSDVLKQEIEAATLKNIEYILGYKATAEGAKSAKYFQKMEIIKPIALNVYPQIYIDMVKTFPRAEAVQHLRNLGHRVAKFYYACFPDELKKHYKFTDIFSIVAKDHMHEKITFNNIVKEKKRLVSADLEVTDCFFCSGATLIEGIDIPYCTAKAGVYESLYNIKSLYNRNLDPRLVHISTIKSAEEEGDTCEYHLKVIE
jgi:hypothetical protein